MENIQPVLLIIMDGFGLSPITEGNAVYQAKTPCFDNLIRNYPTALLHASGQEVGLSFGEMGNSEVGHLNLGTGRVVIQDLPRINQSIKSGVFFENAELIEACEYANKNSSTLHLIGLASNGGVHSHIDHLLSLIELAGRQKVKKVAIHMITDGRDTSPKVAKSFVKKIEEKIKSSGTGTIATVIGRYYAMDRDKHWEDRTKLAYELFTEGKGEKFSSASEAIDNGYQKNESDETLSPKIIESDYIIKEKDAVISYNYRIDRIKQISDVFIDPTFKEYPRGKYINNLLFVSFTNYGFEPTNFVKIAFLSTKLSNPLSEMLAQNNCNNLHIAETEKYAHVTYFFNGGEEKPFKFENRILVPSPRVKSYNEKPEMSAKTVTSKFLSYFKSKKPLFTVLNFANPDMVGHTGDMKATVKAVEVVDSCVGEIIKSIGSVAKIIVTADHGNAEQMINPETGGIDKEHTTNPVPFIIYSDKKIQSELDKMTLSAIQPVAVLADVAPTILSFLNIKPPKEMNGQNLRDAI
jgi:2,3-bisphosphoglycerate-independent phosphoglycerate mutase